jgi:hypothetical protein
VAVDAQREAGVGVPKLPHHGAGIDAEGDQQRREGVPQLVRRQPLRDRHVANPLEPFVGALSPAKRASRSATGGLFLLIRSGSQAGPNGRRRASRW